VPTHEKVAPSLLVHQRRARDHVDGREPGRPRAGDHAHDAGPPLDPEAAEFVRRQLGKGQMGGLGLRVDDCRKTYDELSAAGVEFVQEPADRPYGVEAVMRDVSGNWLVLVAPREFTPGG
jgi:catechol 2,3-dioxygenase-like lactoylglutathione lyase family enzyme